MSSVPSRFAANLVLGSSMGNKDLAAISFPLGWSSKAGPIFVWYNQLPCTKFTSMQHRKEREGPFFHEFLCVKLTNDNVCQFERFGDPDARADAITTKGSVAHDLAEILSAERLAALDKTSDVVDEVTFPCELDLMDILEICYNIQRDYRTRAYTLQRYNCYFFCWCILLVLTRKAAAWEDTLSTTAWDQIVQNFESDLFRAAETDQDMVVFRLYRWLAPSAPCPEKYAIQALREELLGSRDMILNSLRNEIRLTLFADWVERQAATCISSTAAQYIVEHFKAPQPDIKESGWVGKFINKLINKLGANDKKSVQNRQNSTAATIDPSKAVAYGIEDEEEEGYNTLWSQAVGELLKKHLIPLIERHILTHESQQLRVTYSLDKNRDTSMVPEFQIYVEDCIFVHGIRVQQYGLGSSEQICLDVKQTIITIWRLMGTEKIENGA